MAEIQKFKIISVEIVEGNILNTHWKGKMQIITTDKGKFIDNLEGITYGGFKGHNWVEEIGKTISAKVVKSANQEWLQYLNI